jgi:hypothetical protein
VIYYNCTDISLTSLNFVTSVPCEMPLNPVNSCFKQRAVLQQVPVINRCPSFKTWLLKATIVQVNLCSPCPSVACPISPIFTLANCEDCEQETLSISVGCRHALEIKPEVTSHPVCLLTRLCQWHSLLQK